MVFIQKKTPWSLGGTKPFSMSAASQFFQVWVGAILWTTWMRRGWRGSWRGVPGSGWSGWAGCPIGPWRRNIISSRRSRGKKKTSRSRNGSRSKMRAGGGRMTKNLEERAGKLHCCWYYRLIQYDQVNCWTSVELCEIFVGRTKSLGGKEQKLEGTLKNKGLNLSRKEKNWSGRIIM